MKKIIIIVTMFFMGVLASANVYAVQLPVIEQKFNSIPNYHNVYTVYGVMTEFDTRLEKKDVVIYDSFWNGAQPNTIETINDEYNMVYKFGKYFDIPIQTLETIQFPKGEYSRYYERIDTFSVTNQESTKKAMSLAASTSTTIGVSLGLSADNVDIGSSASSTITMNLNKYNEVTYAKTETHSIQEKVSYTETYINDTDKNMYFQRNYRQKFAAYLMLKYKYEYTITEWGTGLWGKDKNWSYTFKELVVSDKYIYLVPIESPYYTVSKYIDGNTGLKQFYQPVNSNIYYF